MLEILFLDTKTGDVIYAATDVSRVRYITPTDICFDADGRTQNFRFSITERVEVSHKTDSPMRAALMRSVSHA